MLKRVFSVQTRSPHAGGGRAIGLRHQSIADPPLLELSQKTAPDGKPTHSAHPARFSPDDKFSRQRVTLKKRFDLLPKN